MADNENTPDPVPGFEVVVIEVMFPHPGQQCEGPTFEAHGNAMGESTFGPEWEVKCTLTGGDPTVNETVTGTLQPNGEWHASFSNLPPAFHNVLLTAKLIKNNQPKASSEVPAQGYVRTGS